MNPRGVVWSFGNERISLRQSETELENVFAWVRVRFTPRPLPLVVPDFLPGCKRVGVTRLIDVTAELLGELRELSIDVPPAGDQLALVTRDHRQGRGSRRASVQTGNRDDRRPPAGVRAASAAPGLRCPEVWHTCQESIQPAFDRIGSDPRKEHTVSRKPSARRVQN